MTRVQDTPQNLSVLSSDPETTRRPSGDTATQLTCVVDRSATVDPEAQDLLALEPGAIDGALERVRTSFGLDDALDFIDRVRLGLHLDYATLRI